MIAADLLLLGVFLTSAYALAGTLANHSSMASRVVLASLLVFGLVIVTGSLLLLLDAFSVRVVLACGALLVLAWAGLASRGDEGHGAPRPSGSGNVPGTGTGGGEIVLGAFLLASLLAAPGFEITAMGSDAGVYVNRALQLATHGDLFPVIRVDVEALPPALRDTYLADNARMAGTVLVEGAKLELRGGTRSIEFHALPAWPIVLAVAAHFGGVGSMQFASVLILATWALSLYVILMHLTRRADVSVGVAILATILPISIYFAKYPTVELLLAMTFGGMVYLVATRPRRVGVLAGALVGVYALVHMSGFVLVLVALLALPLILPLLEAPARREVSSFLAVAGLSHLLALAWARQVSGGYVGDLLAMGFGTTDRGWLVLVSLDLAAIAAAAMSRPWRQQADAR